MTLVAAAKFGEWGVILSDTMITDDMLGKRNILPGRLKAIVISRDVSIAYAGASDPAIDIIRAARLRLLHGHNLTDLPEFLLSELKQRELVAHIDFAVAMHSPNLRLLKISNGFVAEPAYPFFLGDETLFDKMMNMKDDRPRTQIPGISPEEESFRWRFHQLFRSTVDVSNSVGGIAVDLLASPGGHTYNNYAISTNTDVLSLNTGWTEDQLLRARSGETLFSRSVGSTSTRGVAILYCHIAEIEIGIIHSPLIYDDPKVFSPIPFDQLCEIAEAEAKSLQGVELQRIG